MEILYTVLNTISSLVTEVLYDRSLVNSLFSFDLNKRYVVFNHAKYKKKDSNENNRVKDIQKVGTIDLRQKIQELESNKNIEIYTKENSGEQTIIPKTKVSSTRKKIVKKKRTQKSSTLRSPQNSHNPLKEQISHNENVRINDNKLSIEENRNMVNNIYNVNNEHLGTMNDNITTSEKDLTNVYINDWLICRFWCSNRKKNINKILFEEGSRIVTKRLDILAMFDHFYLIEIMQKKLGIEAKGMNMSDRCKDNLQIYYMNNNYKTITN
jgi:hypothetical protein